MHSDTGKANIRRSNRKMFSEFITKNFIPIIDLEGAAKFVRMRSNPYFLLLVLILPSFTARFLWFDLNSTCCFADWISLFATSFLRA
jgi:hypothetical protein